MRPPQLPPLNHHQTLPQSSQQTTPPPTPSPSHRDAALPHICDTLHVWNCRMSQRTCSPKRQDTAKHSTATLKVHAEQELLSPLPRAVRADSTTSDELPRPRPRPLPIHHTTTHERRVNRVNLCLLRKIPHCD
ncbi:hypothetical protein Vi05172_g4630 [Venturia inaequalis]|nr:hypothetical protein Vi05172_g4630 [Venturia inaequalis]